MPSATATKTSSSAHISTLSLGGLSCASCAGKVERALLALSGVGSVSVNMTTERATIEHVAGKPSIEQMIEAVEHAGYQAQKFRQSREESQTKLEDREADARHLLRNTILAAALTLPVFALEMGGHLHPGIHHWVMENIGRQNSWLIQFTLATLVLLGPGLTFFKLGLPALLQRRPDMNSLVALGSGAAYLYSVVATFASTILPPGTDNVYYEPAALIVTLILLGRYLEHRAKGRTGEAIEKLLSLRVKTAKVWRGSDFVDTPIDEVQVGDRVQVRPGESVPVDGEVTEGNSYVDESMISGEPVPVKKEEGSEVIGGTINNSGSFVFRATRVGSDTMLSKIVRMVEDAQGAKLPIQAMVDRVTMWFVPVVMGLAVLAFALWWMVGPEPRLTYSLVVAVTILIIACPCAMGLATPTSIMVGTGRAAELGVLFRRGDALQSLQEADVIAFDKTGTLTQGHPELTDLLLSEGFKRAEVLALVASVERLSEHPIAAAIVRRAQDEGTALSSQVTDFEAHSGLGVTATVEGREIAVGAERFMLSLGLPLEQFEAQAEQMAKEGKSPFYAVVSGKLAAVLAVSDPLKDTTASALRGLRAMGKKTAMITGDNATTAKALAKKLDIDEVVSEVMPEGKVEAIEELQRRYGVVAFVGDGINDAPALASADVGLAIGTGTDVAIESADVVLMSGDLSAVLNAVEISQSTMSNIRQNLFWAFAYNTILIPVAGGALYPIWGTLLSPALAAGAMACSSLFVVANALRLKQFKPTQIGNQP
jgi:heavy metal translocating P-type ATPase